MHPNDGFWRQLRDLEAALTASGIARRPRFAWSGCWSFEALRSLPEDWKAPEQPKRDAEEAWIAAVRLT